MDDMDLERSILGCISDLTLPSPEEKEGVVNPAVLSVCIFVINLEPHLAKSFSTSSL